MFHYVKDKYKRLRQVGSQPLLLLPYTKKEAYYADGEYLR